jgi:hypothetical protein
MSERVEAAGIEPASSERTDDSEEESDLAGPDAGQIASESSHEVASTDDDPRSERGGRRNYLRLRLREQAMSRPGELTPRAWWLSPRELENRGLKRCEHCEQLLPMTVSRCRRRQCPAYSETWARDTMRKIRENLRAYEGLVCMCTLTAPGEAMGLVWDRENCTHRDEVKCGREHGCTVLPAAAALWNEKSRS